MALKDVTVVIADVESGNTYTRIYRCDYEGDAEDIVSALEQLTGHREGSWMRNE